MRKVTTEEFQGRLDEIYGNGVFIVLEDYINNETKINILHTTCGNVIRKRPVKMTGSEREGCYFCSGKNHYKTKELLQKEVNAKYPDSYIIIEDYINARTPIFVKRILCGHEYKISPDNLLRGKGCPACGIKQSKYMDFVEKYLKDKNILFEKEKYYDDCRYVRKLPFDYYLPSYNVCIEVDGEFHFEDNSVYKNWHSGRSSYEEVKKRDGIKTKYCLDNGIKLIRLPYYDFNVFNEILDEELEQYMLTPR